MKLCQYGSSITTPGAGGYCTNISCFFSSPFFSSSSSSSFCGVGGKFWLSSEVLSNLHCRCSVVLFLLVFLHIPVILILFTCGLQLCRDSDEQLRLHGGPQLRRFNHCHCQGGKFNKMTWRVKEAVAVSFTGIVEPVTTQDPHKDLSQYLTHGHAHRVALENICGGGGAQEHWQGSSQATNH
ncbi:hypothetical protein EYF80_037879 [Liparis tanakae]|uniref:Uncharacterized protein n=1 Tax=Liparis tanakae TaxID=230148 RepID=A0A4Z2GED2_9TELE|nr:hypothetical protein EYF80_037879 [Liparis tanakae]